ncbi:MAG: hypothetical protein HRT88_18670, partial [Lentisphaeraceae bacterium]|nr:hypothetical protein [Lentisphaeraceae bacterium]
DEILDYMLFVDEVSLRNVGVDGGSGFKEDFRKGKVQASNGDSLYDLDFGGRIASFPCSWLIYSDSFKGLPEPLKEVLLLRLMQILTSEDLADEYVHLIKTRKRIDVILRETHEAYARIDKE